MMVGMLARLGGQKVSDGGRCHVLRLVVVPSVMPFAYGKTLRWPVCLGAVGRMEGRTGYGRQVVYGGRCRVEHLGDVPFATPFACGKTLQWPVCWRDWADRRSQTAVGALLNI